MRRIRLGPRAARAAGYLIDAVGYAFSWGCLYESGVVFRPVFLAVLGTRIAYPPPFVFATGVLAMVFIRFSLPDYRRRAAAIPNPKPDPRP